MSIKEGFIITDDTNKKRILNDSLEIKNYIFLSYKALLDKVYGSVEDKAIFLLMEEYALTYDLALEYMKYIPYIKDICYNDEKLDSIATAKRLLMKKGLIKEDEFFLYRLSKMPITFTKRYNTKQFEALVKELSLNTYVYFEENKSNGAKPIVYEYKSIIDEAYDIFNTMKELHKKGIPYHKMHLLNMNQDYEFIFKRLSESYNIPICFNHVKNISHTKFAKRFQELSNTIDNYDDILNQMEESSFLKPLINTIIKYSLEDKNPKDYINFFKKIFKSFCYEEDIYSDMVNVSSSLNIKDDEYAFYLGLNQGVSPKIYKDEGYLSDKELEILNLPTTIEKNKEERNELIYFIENTKNIHLSYSLTSKIKELFPSLIIAELGLTVKNKIPSYGYSKIEDDLRLANLLSIYDKTHELDLALDYYDIKHIPYNSYDNKFKGIPKSFMQERYKDEASLSFSYSTMKYYFECPFHYYADKVLNLQTYEDSLATRLGTFSHAILEDSYKEDFDFNASSSSHKEEILKDIEYEEIKKGEFYFSQMEEVLSDLIEYNKRHEELSKFNQIECEAHIEYIEDNLKFHGYIDKLLYTEIYGEIYAAIMDYKTGKDYISLDNVEDGFHLQLPSYMYLLSKYEKFKGKRIHIIGIYLQKVNMISLDNSIDIISQREKSFRLQGYTTIDKSLIPYLDPNYFKSDYIASMMTLKDGSFGRYAKVIDSKDEERLISTVDELIHKAKDGVMNGDFKIAPKKIKNNDVSCMFCKYKDLCFKKYEDYIYLKEKKFKEKEE